MGKEAVFTFKLEADLRSEFIAEAEALDRPASQIMRELMRDFIAKRQDRRDYDAFVRRKVAKSRASMDAGRLIASEEVEQRFAALRSSVSRES